MYQNDNHRQLGSGDRVSGWDLNPTILLPIPKHRATRARDYIKVIGRRKRGIKNGHGT